MATHLLSVIIVNWNTAGDLERCLESHLKAIRNIKEQVETIVIDNASTDRTKELFEKFKARKTGIRFVENENNIGFAKACNQGLSLAGGENLLLLNPDTVLFEDSYTKALEFVAREKEHLGVLGIRTLNLDLSIQPSVWPEPGLARLSIEAFFLHRLLPAKLRGRWLLSGYFDYAETREVGMVLGAFFWITRRCYDKLSGFHDDIFMFGEDLEYCMRARRAGFKVLYFHDAKFIHAGNQSTSQRAPQWRIERTVGTQYFVLSLVHSRVWLLLFNVLELCAFGLRAITSVLKSPGRSGYVASKPLDYFKAHVRSLKTLLQPHFRDDLRRLASEA